MKKPRVYSYTDMSTGYTITIRDPDRRSLEDILYHIQIMARNPGPPDIAFHDYREDIAFHREVTMR